MIYIEEVFICRHTLPGTCNDTSNIVRHRFINHRKTSAIFVAIVVLEYYDYYLFLEHWLAGTH